MLAPFLFIIAIDYTLLEATSETHIGFKLTTCQSSCYPAINITNTDFADDLALISNTLEEAQILLLRLQTTAEAVGLHIKYKKMEYVFYNQTESNFATQQGNRLNLVDNIKYLGSWIQSSQKDMKVRISQAWNALNKMDRIWKCKDTYSKVIGWMAPIQRC